jgi:DDE superfamily endonuclease
MAYCPRSSLPATVLGWLVRRLAHLAPPRPPGKGGTRPLSLEVRLDAVAAVLLDGLSYRRAGRRVGISKTAVGDSLDLLLGPLGRVGFCQPDGAFITTLGELGEWLAEMDRSGEAVCLDGPATRVQRPRGWANQKVVYDAKRHSHTAQGLAVSTIWGDLLWVDGGWPGSCHEHELVELSGLAEVLDGVEVTSLLDRGFRGLAKAREHLAYPGRGPPHQGPAHRGAAGLQPPAGGAARAGGAGDRPPGQRLVAAPLAGLLSRVRDVFRATGALICLGRWLHRVPA